MVPRPTGCSAALRVDAHQHGQNLLVQAGIYPQCRNSVLAGSGSQPDPTRRGSPADGREHVHQTRPGTGASAGLITGFLRRIDDLISRTFTAAAMAEDGTEEMALEMLEGRPAEPSEDPEPTDASESS